nr:MAG TPA: hypothetical protein [Caudoviricetes sp.]
MPKTSAINLHKFMALLCVSTANHVYICGAKLVRWKNSAPCAPLKFSG